MDEIKDPKKSGLSNNESKVIKIVFVIGLIYVVITIFGIQLVSDEFKNYFKENGETILSFSVLLFSIILLFSIYGVTIDDNKKKKIKKEVTIESFNTDAYSTNEIVNGNPDVASKFSKLETKNVDVAFCENSMSSDEKNENCKKLTKGNCTTVGCCVLLNGEKCVGGGESGPTYLNENGKDIDVKYFMFKDKCIGKGCPS
jgi:hypothetical protein